MPLFVITVAACMLKALSPEAFANAWRTTCPLVITTAAPKDSSDKSYLDLHVPVPWVSPEIIVLAALAIADVFSPYDRDRSDKWWVFQVAHGRYTLEQFNVTKRCILIDLEHNLMPFTDKAKNRAMVREMAKWHWTVVKRVADHITRTIASWGEPATPSSWLSTPSRGRSRRRSPLPPPPQPSSPPPPSPPPPPARVSNYQPPTVSSATFTSSADPWSTSSDRASAPAELTEDNLQRQQEVLWAERMAYLNTL